VPPEADHAGAAADIAFRDRPDGRRFDRLEDVRLGDMKGVHVVEVRVASLTHDGQQPGIGPELRAEAAGDPADEGLVHGAEAVRVRDPDRAHEVAGLLDPMRAGHLAVAVERMKARPNGCGDRPRPAAGEHHGDARARRAFGAARSGVVDERGVSDLDARHIGDRVMRTWRAGKREAEIAPARLGSGGPAGLIMIVHRAAAPYRRAP
jgi:hypothetical protein